MRITRVPEIKHWLNGDCVLSWLLKSNLSNMRCLGRQLGPEKGVIHLAVAAIINALWDLWARIDNKPLWKLLVDLDPEDLVSLIDFRYM